MKTLNLLILLAMTWTDQISAACNNIEDFSDCETPLEALKVVRRLSPYQVPESAHLTNFRLSRFEYDKETLRGNTWTLKERTSRYVIEKNILTAKNPLFDKNKVKSFSNKEILKVNLILYRPLKIEGPRPLVVIFPTILEAGAPEHLVAQYMAKKGMAVAIAEVEFLPNPLLPLVEVEKLQRRDLIKGKMILDYFEKNENQLIDLDKVGTWGISLGGVRAATFVGIDDRVKAAAFMSAGGNSADILTHSIQDFVKRFRKIRLETEYLPLQNFFNIIRVNSNADPIYFAKRVDPRNIYMIMPKADKKVHTRTQLELWDAFGRPGPEGDNWVSGDHLSAITPYVLYPWAKAKVYKFFKDRLDIRD